MASNQPSPKIIKIKKLRSTWRGTGDQALNVANEVKKKQIKKIILATNWRPHQPSPNIKI